MIETNNGLIQLNENSYQTLLDMGYSQADALKKVKDAMSAQELAHVIQQRQLAYKSEADPLFIESKFDGTPEAEQKWRDKIAEIKARYPKPAA